MNPSANADLLVTNYLSDLGNRFLEEVWQLEFL